MKIMVFLLLLIVGYMAFIRDDGTVTAARINAATAANVEADQRISEQAQILVELQSLKEPHVSDFVSDWQSHTPVPSPEQLSELRLIQQNIRNDKGKAEMYTLKWKSDNALCSLKGLFDDFKCKPGL